jgi:hypothetical protein
MAGTFTITGADTGLPTGGQTVGPLTVVGTAVVGEMIPVILASGDNTISVPSGAVGVLIVPPTTNTNTLKYRTSSNSGDTGLSIAPASFSVHMFPLTAPTSLIVNAAGAVSVATFFKFI